MAPGAVRIASSKSGILRAAEHPEPHGTGFQHLAFTCNDRRPHPGHRVRTHHLQTPRPIQACLFIFAQFPKKRAGASRHLVPTPSQSAGASILPCRVVVTPSPKPREQTTLVVCSNVSALAFSVRLSTSCFTRRIYLLQTNYLPRRFYNIQHQ